MTMEEFIKKWGNIRIGHESFCPKNGGFDYEICNCGLDKLHLNILVNCHVQQS